MNYERQIKLAQIAATLAHDLAVVISDSSRESRLLALALTLEVEIEELKDLCNRGEEPLMRAQDATDEAVQALGDLE